jgi:hypothetical protein
MSEDKKDVAESKLSLSEEMHLGFLQSIAKTNTEKITREILEGLSEDTGDSDSYDVDSGGEGSEDRPWRPSHAVFGKSSIKQSHLVSMRGRYFRDLSIVRADEGEKTCPTPEENEVVIFRSFFKAGLRFPLSSFVVEVMKIFKIFLHKITPEAIIRMGIFVWPKRKKMKVLTHRPHYIEPATVPEFVGETSSATEAKEPTLLPNIEGLAKVPATKKIEEPRAEETKTSEILSPSAKIEVPMPMPMTTPKRKRMVNVLDVLETIKSSSTTPKKIGETSEVQIEALGAEASKHQAETEAGPSEPAKVKSLKAEEIETTEQIWLKKLALPPPKHFPKLSIIFYDMLGERIDCKRKARGSVLCPKTEISKGGVDIQRQRRRRLLVLSP